VVAEKTLNVYKTIWKKTSIFIGVPDYEGGNGKAQLTLQTEFFMIKELAHHLPVLFMYAVLAGFFSLKVLECF